MSDAFSFCDHLGPLKVIHVHVPEYNVKGTLVVDNVAIGPAIGGLRMAPDVTTEECFRLARAMTLKNAAAGLRHGGGKSVMVGDPRMPRERKEDMIRAFANALASETHYIFGPDMGTNEQCMAWIRDEIGRAVGLPREFGGIPLDELGATGYGLACAADVAIEYCDFALRDARLAVQGFGSVGMHAARFQPDRAAVPDRAVACPTGWDYDPRETIDIGRLAVKTGQWPLKEYFAGKVVHTHPPRPRLPVEAYLERQGRYRHLFEPGRNDAVIAEIQARIDAYWAEVEDEN